MSDEIQNRDNHQNLIAEVQSNLRFIVTIAIFLPAIIYYFFRAANETEYASSEASLPYAIFVGVYLIDYILLEIIKNKISVKSLKSINYYLLFGIGFFIMPIIVMALKIYKLPSILKFALPISLYGLKIVPLSLFVIILWSIVSWPIKK